MDGPGAVNVSAARSERFDGPVLDSRQTLGAANVKCPHPTVATLARALGNQRDRSLRLNYAWFR